ncbi:hypothetical protein JHJ32_06320 [Parapedobacter sp. ISTM3]|uniref:Cbb3-type cytochrome oxidase component FixQ n=1 Tax=Parapedobacter luteus TaxID=623280 RepID=A0A1T5BCD9_9SPHI|nr:MULTISPECIES: hypothetical protein [Parapedobacter]MBK1439592.1 hypothetical protein [Parapedobacter sp. ISTM3]SKB44981.1 hypothetical protein SAMN05660226_01385 [Parapedobacter luteus]
MFKQITDLSGNEWYLIASLWIFLIFFIVVAIMLVRMRKDYVDYMKEIPMNDVEEQENSILH